MTEVGYAFLTTGPRFTIALPTDFDALASLSSPLRHENGGRSYDFVPALHDLGRPEPENHFVDALTDSDGRRVELYQREEPPLMWWLRWPLSNGALYTHVREEDGIDFARLVIVPRVSVVEQGLGGTPSIIPELPLVRGVSARPGYQEYATYYCPSRGHSWSVTLFRPGFLPEGTVVQLPRRDVGSQVVIRAGARYGMEVSVTAGLDYDGGRNVLSAVLNSLREG